MTFEEVKDTLYNIVEGYFKGAQVVWGRTNQIKPNKPLICLDMGVQRRVWQPIKEMTGTEEISYSLVVVPLMVELFTHGKCVKYNGKSYYENVAINDMDDFLGYIDSEHVLNICNEKNICLIPSGEVTDTSAVQDNDYEYRAKTEIEVRFCLVAKGGAGISRYNWQQTSSGGGTQELAEEETGIIETAQVEEEE